MPNRYDYTTYLVAVQMLDRAMNQTSGPAEWLELNGVDPALLEKMVNETLEHVPEPFNQLMTVFALGWYMHASLLAKSFVDLEES